MFSTIVNTTTGKTEWKIIEDKELNASSGLVRSQYGDMLHDNERNKAYFKGVQYAIDAIRRQNKEPVVLDIGTGTGLLAMMAAKCGARKITACEVLAPMAKIASEVITQNGYGDVIKVVPLRSTDLVVEKGGVMEEKANILVTEIFDTELIGEGVLPTLSHAHQHLLEPDAIVVPSAATVYVQLFHSPYLWASHKLDAKNILHSVVTVPESWQHCAGPASLWDMHVEELDNNQITFLSEPQIAAEFTFKRPLVTASQQCEVCVTHNGLLHGLVMWWELYLCPDVSLSTSPWKRTQWRDHWLQGIQLLPSAFYVMEGKKMFVQTHNDDYCLWFTVDEIKKSVEADTIERPLCTCGAHIVWNRSRMSMLNNSCRNKLFYDLLSKQTLDHQAVLCVSDESLLPLMLAKLGVKKIFVTESVSSFSTRVMKEIIKANNVENCITSIPGSSEDLSLLDTQGTKIDMVIGEPYFSSTLLPWHSLYFWYVRTYVNHLLINKPEIIPYKAHLQAIAVKFENLHKLRSVVSTVEDFDLSAYQTFIEKDASCEPEPHFLWEYPCISCSHCHDIFEFNFMRPLDLHTVIETSGAIPLIKSGANAVVFWMIYHLDKFHSISEGLTKDPILGSKLHWNHRFKQAVKFLCERVDGTNRALNYCAKFCAESGDLSINIYST